MASRGSKKKRNSPAQIKKLQEEQKKAARKLWWEKHKKVLAIALCCIIGVGIIIGVAVKVSSGEASGDPGSSGKYTLMDLGSHGCIPCDNLQPVLSSLRSKYKGKIDVLFYDVNNTTKGAQLANQYGVSTIPTLIFLDKNGKVVKRLVGFHTQEQLENEFKSLGWI